MRENPFRFGALALDEAFTDRERELAELVSDVRNGQDVVILGPRRYGKSSLVFRATLELPARLSAERNRRVALVFDEFQEITDLDPHYPKLLRAVFQQQPEVAHVYLGSKRHLMRQIFNDEHEPFWRSAKQMELGPIEPERFAPFVRERLAATDRGIDEATLERLL